MKEILMTRKDWAWCYKVDNGLMECPPFVKSVGDVESYFEGSEYKPVFKDIPVSLRAKAKPKFAEYKAEKKVEKAVARVIEKPKKPTVKFGQYDKEGNLIAVYRSLKEAGEGANVSPNSISHAFQRKKGLCGGYMWRKGETLPKKIDGSGSYRASRVAQYTKDGKFIAEYPSLASAAKAVNRASVSLSDAIARNGMCGGYKWKKL